MTTIFGIHNCDTVKKARKWLDNANVPYTFHDFRVDGLTEACLQSFVSKSSWEAIINKRSTTYRNLDDDAKASLTGDAAIALVLANPTLIKRPVLLKDEEVVIGFKAQTYQELFSHA